MGGPAPDITLEPQDGPQALFCSSPADITIFGGQAGGGKTYGALLEAARHHENARFGAVIFRRVSPSITDEGGLWDTSWEVYPRLDARPLKSPTHQWRFPSGARVSFHHLQYEEDRLKWKSAQVPLIIWDQLEEFTELQFWYLQSRNRAPPGIDVSPYMRATCNPVPPDDPVGGWLHRLIGWWIDQETGYAISERSGVVRWFYRVEDELVWFDSEDEADLWAEQEGLDERERPISVSFIQSRLEDNPALEEADPLYRSKLAALPRVERERLLHGNWLVRDSAGELLDRSWFRVVDAAPSAYLLRLRYWDKAGTEGGTGAESAGSLLTWGHDGRIYVEDVTHGRWKALARERVIKQCAQGDSYETIVVVEQEPGSSGKDVAEATIRLLSGWDVRADRVTGSKLVRSGPYRAQAEVGNVVLVRGEWNEPYLRQAHSFDPKKGVKDMIDSSVGAFNYGSKLLAEYDPHAMSEEIFDGEFVL